MKFKMDLRGLFKSMAGQKTPSDSMEAQWGTVFQTCAFRQPLMPPLGDFFLRARQGPDKKWTIFRISERPDGPAEMGGERVLAQEKVKTGLNFIEALVYLANFENTAPDLKYEAVDPAGQAALGFRHFLAFAHREGFIFDKATGRPVKTENGEIEEAGTFAITEVALFRQHFDAKAQPGQDEENELVRALLPEKGFQKIPAGMIVDMNYTIAWMGKFVDAVDRLKAKEIEWREDCLKGSDPFQGKIGRALEEISKILENAGGIRGLDSETLDQMKRGVHIVYLFSQIESAQFSLNHPKYAEHFESCVTRMKDHLDLLHLPGNFADAAILREPDLHSETLPEPAEEFIKNCHGALDALNNALAAARKGEGLSRPAALPPPAVPLLKP